MHPAIDMYRLVHDVPSYPGFLRWCTYAEVHEQSDEHQLASLGVRVAGMEQRFKTRNTLVPGERLGMSLVEGPFRALAGEWRFKALGEHGSKVSLSLTFDFKPGLISSAFQRGFRSVADHLVQDFCRRADELLSDGNGYGESTHGR
jgi:ribosome-associated toxin RatA of RatAB toxin-antitoxin module